MVNKKKIISLFLIITLCCVNVFSQTETSRNNTFDESTIILEDNSGVDSESNQSSIKTPSTAGLLIKLILILVIIIGLIYGVLWFIKKKTNIVKSEDDFLRRAAYLNIAPGKTVEVITLIDKAYLIGVTEDNITMLGEIEDKELINAMNVNADKYQNVKKPLNFADVLDIFTAKKKTSNVFEDSEKKLNEIYQNNGENKENV